MVFIFSDSSNGILKKLAKARRMAILLAKHVHLARIFSHQIQIVKMSQNESADVHVHKSEAPEKYLCLPHWLEKAKDDIFFFH